MTGEKVLAPVSALPLPHCLPGKLPGMKEVLNKYVTIVKLAHELTVETLRQISNLECLFTSVQACNHGHLVFTLSLSRGLTPRYFCFSKPSLYNKDASQCGDTFFFLKKKYYVCLQVILFLWSVQYLPFYGESCQHRKRRHRRCPVFKLKSQF